jgi:hypothetical protein
MQALRDQGQHSARAHPPAAQHADLETGRGTKMPVMRDAAILATGAHDQAHETPGGSIRICGCIRTRNGNYNPRVLLISPRAES